MQKRIVNIVVVNCRIGSSSLGGHPSAFFDPPSNQRRRAAHAALLPGSQLGTLSSFQDEVVRTGLAEWIGL